MLDARLRLERVRRLTPELHRKIDQLSDVARQVDGVRPFGEHKWLRLIRGDDRFVALILRDHEVLLAAAHCKAYRATQQQPMRLVAEMVVSPTHRRRGLGSRLFEGLLELGRTQHAQEIQMWAYGNLPSAQHLANRFAFSAQRTLLQYVLDGALLPREAPTRSDVHVRAFDADRDAERWLALHHLAFADHPEQSAWDISDLALRMHQPWFNAADFLVAEDIASGKMVGFCWVKLPVDASQPGEIYIVGVDPALRGRSLGRFVTEAGLAHIRARGRSAATLYVEASNVAARSLYERLGFVTRHEHVCYARR